MKNNKTWIWQSEQWPNFVYNTPDTHNIYQKFGQLYMAEALLSPEDVLRLKTNTLEVEAIATSLLEGEVLSQKSLSSSISKHLKSKNTSQDSTPSSDALVDLLIDAKRSNAPLTPPRLFAWHKALFPIQKKGAHPIHTGTYRDVDAKEVKIISGTWEKEVLHYLAPPAKDIELEMNRFLLWLNTENRLDLVVKSAIAHLWFLLIHPFDDGNRRLARDISDHVLSSSSLIPSQLFTLAFEINEMKDSYYKSLDKVCAQEGLDISLWLQWYVKMLSSSLDTALQRIDALKTKALFWEKIKTVPLNQRQRQLISKMLHNELQEKKVKTAFYAQTFKVSKPTSARDLRDLHHKKILKSFGAGRGVYYELRGLIS